MTSSKDVITTRLAVKVTPNAGRSAVVGVKEGVWQIKIGAAPEKGKANKELVDFLADKLGIKKSAVIIVKGQTARHKTVIIEGLTPEEVSGRLGK